MNTSIKKTIKRAFNYCKNILITFEREGLPGVYSRLKKLLYLWDGLGFWHNAEIERILKNYKHNYKIVLVPPTKNWNIELFQRPQQLALEFAKIGYLFFYCPGDPFYDKVKGLKTLKKNLYLTNCYKPILKKINKFIYLLSNVTYLSVSIQHLKKIRKEKDFILIYDYLDEYEALGYLEDEEIKESFNRHRYLIKEADIVTCTADKLFFEVKKIREKDVYLLPNGSDYNHFGQTKRSLSRPPAFKKNTNQRPIIGYFGALAEWFDYDLMNFLVVENPNLDFVLIGPHFNNSLKAFKKSSNLHYKGIVPYKILPQYASRFDVAIIPFKINKVTEATSPIKLFEYMALGKPIVSTNLPECRKYRSVLIANTKKEFSGQLKKALKLKNDKNYLRIIDQEAKRNTWADRVSQLDKIISRKTK